MGAGFTRPPFQAMGTGSSPGPAAGNEHKARRLTSLAAISKPAGTTS